MTDDAPGCREDLEPSSDRCLRRLGRILRRSIPRGIAGVNRSDVAGEGLHDPIAGRWSLVLFLESLDVAGELPSSFAMASGSPPI